MPVVSYRSYGDRSDPQQIRITVPGWAGSSEQRVDGSHEQPWHCIPFSESARYGVELLYPFDPELHVRSVDGKVVLEADWGAPPEEGAMWPPFRAFGEDYYSYQLSLDLAAPPGWAIRCEPHPRFFTDATNSTPLAVPALIRSEWWPMINFCIFKAPPPGTTHVFRKGEPFISFICIPSEPELELLAMGREDAAQREMRSRRLSASRDALAEGTRWLSSTNTVFDGTYRNMARAARAHARQKSGE
ncbi:hypothetical protein [Novosphingobium sediminicola]|uniref:Uncharacterized protein n=1 Tax=Novosphingobium sediminicola TaxID=563162 RepID=A0A7W6GA04_9SPHN|nr:hypothetical protein [Novosphingobium sediminicola]MBB3957612.1 hypothetical protein [Novosphingobium sediminicola]